jgi:hypothetical protein
MSGRGNGGKGLGTGGAKRHRSVLRDHIWGITKGSIRRPARRVSDQCCKPNLERKSTWTPTVFALRTRVPTNCDYRRAVSGGEECCDALTAVDLFRDRERGIGSGP